MKCKLYETTSHVGHDQQKSRPGRLQSLNISVLMDVKKP